MTFASPSGGSSPSIADTNDVFPSPVPPTIAIRLPTGTSRFILDNVGLSACKIVNSYTRSQILSLQNY